MKNRNYVSWDITQLLPDINPYYAETNAEWWGMYDKPKYGTFNRPPSIEELKDIRLKMPSQDYSIIKETKTQGRMFLKRAWTWEDVRLYLESKGFRLSNTVDTNNRNYFCVDVWIWEEDAEGYLKISFIEETFELAREESIKYCLEKMKENEN